MGPACFSPVVMATSCWGPLRPWACCIAPCWSYAAALPSKTSCGVSRCACLAPAWPPTPTDGSVVPNPLLPEAAAASQLSGSSADNTIARAALATACRLWRRAVEVGIAPLHGTWCARASCVTSSLGWVLTSALAVGYGRMAPDALQLPTGPARVLLGGETPLGGGYPTCIVEQPR